MDRKTVGRLSISGEIYPIFEGMNTIGRELDAHISIRNLKFSKRHAVISVIGSEHYLTDFNSINGTRLRGASLKPYLFYKLNHKAIVMMGDAVGTYLIESEIHQSPKTPEPTLLCDDTNDDIGEATQQIIDESVEILSSQNDEIFIEATQEVNEPVFVIPKTPVKKKPNDCFSGPTQLLDDTQKLGSGDITKGVSESFFIADTEDLNGTMQDKDDKYFTISTQQMVNDADETVVETEEECEEEEFDFLVPNVDDFAAATQRLHDVKNDAPRLDSEIFIAPTQMLRDDFDDTQPLCAKDKQRNLKLDDSEVFIAPTQILQTDYVAMKVADISGTQKTELVKFFSIFSEATQKLSGDDINKTNIDDDNVEKTDTVDDNFEKTDIIDDNVEKSDTVNNNVEKTDTVDDNIEKTDIVDDIVEKTDTVDDNIKKTDIVNDNVEKTDTVNTNVEKTGTVDDNIEKTNIIDDNIEKTDTVDDNIEKTNIIEDNIEKTDTVDDNIEKTDIVDNDETNIVDDSYDDIISSSENESECSEIVIRKKPPKVIHETQDITESDTGSDIEIQHKPPKPIKETQEIERERSRFSFNDSQIIGTQMDESMKLYMSPELKTVLPDAKTISSEPKTSPAKKSTSETKTFDPEPETQLELNIPSQPVFVLATDRPKNPLAQILEKNKQFVVKNPELRKQLEEFVETQVVIESDSETDIETDADDLNESFCNRETQVLSEPSPKKREKKGRIESTKLETEQNVISNKSEKASKSEPLESEVSKPLKTENAASGLSKMTLRSSDAISETKTVTSTGTPQIVPSTSFDAKSESAKRKLHDKNHTDTESEVSESFETENVCNESPKRKLREKGRSKLNFSETEEKNHPNPETEGSELPEPEKPIRNRRRKATSELPENDVIVAPKALRHRNSELDNSEPVPKSSTRHSNTLPTSSETDSTRTHQIVPSTSFDAKSESVKRKLRGKNHIDTELEVSESSVCNESPKRKLRGKGRSELNFSETGEKNHSDPRGSRVRNSVGSELSERSTRHSNAFPTISETDSTRKRQTIASTSFDAKKPKLELRSLRARTAGRAPKHKIVFTMLDDANLEATVGRLGGTVVNSSDECTVLVTKKICRSLKFLTAVALGKPIVGPEWIAQSGRSHRFLDPWDFVLEDAENEEKFGFNLRNALETKTKVFKSCTFLLVCSKNVEVLKSVIGVNGGNCLTKAPARIGDDVVVVAYEEDAGKYKKYLKTKTKVVEAEAIFASSLQQRLDLDSHRLT